MLTLDFQDLSIPLTCITGFSYSLQGNIVDRSDLSCRCLGINPITVQVQIALSMATCVDSDVFEYLARELSQLRPVKGTAPSYITIGGHIVIPQMKFMLASTNISYQSDRLGRLQEMGVNWTLAGSRVVKDENRNTELKGMETDLPEVTLHCLGESIDCAQDISIAAFNLSGFRGRLDLVLGDTYKNISRESWLVDVVNAKDSYIEIEGYGKWYIFRGSIDSDVNWMTLELTKFSKAWYRNQTRTFISETPLTLKSVFPSVEVASKAVFTYMKYDDSPINMIYKLQDSLGYLLGLKGDKIFLYDPPLHIPQGQVTYDFVLDGDTVTTPISKVILRDGVNQFEAGDSTGETFFVQAECRITREAAENVLRYAQFNQNMIALTLPLDRRIALGSIVNVNTGERVIPCVVTEYDIDFLSNSIVLELHYVGR